MPVVQIISDSSEPFDDRKQAGEQLARQLHKFSGQQPVVLGIPRGGIIVAHEIALRLKADLDVTKAGYVLIATADPDGMPHVAAAGRIEIESQSAVAITEWFCPGTIANLRENSGVSVVAWDRASDRGYQLTGRLETAKDVAVLNGYAQGLEGEPPLPQVQRRLLIRVDKIMDFKLRPHSDVEE